jgi:hypothetical protein
MVDLLLEEWKILRDELSRKQELVERVVLSMAGANFAILSLALTEQSELSLLIALLPTIVTSIGYLWLLSFVYSALRIATYIKEVLEPKIGEIEWEGWIKKVRDQHGTPVDRYRLVCSVFYVVSLVTAIAKLATLYDPFDLNQIIDFSERLAGVLLFWIGWLLVTHYMLIKKTSTQIKELYFGISLQDESRE